jgi:hypothetical protein
MTTKDPIRWDDIIFGTIYVVVVAAALLWATLGP